MAGRYCGDMPSLTQAEAIERASAIRVNAYDLDLDLTKGEVIYTSISRIAVTALGAGSEVSTFLDVKPETLTSVTLDGSALPVSALDDGRFPLVLTAGEHEIVVIADMPYTNTGQGLHRFVDPADGKAYTYAMTFLDAAPQMFGCFDQPDLKAPVTLRVTADPQWSVAANGVATQISPGRWECATTKPLATYFTTLIAGPYHVVTAEHDGIPLGIYARASIAEHLDAQAPEIFEITGQCLDRFHELFGVHFPFGKYDQAFVPEFNAGAMENPGCVTFRDEFIFTSAVTDAERETRAEVIAHEMAHMWFGDLVTMRWWDDLWLNESFAEYLGMRVTGESTEFTDVWTSFALARKAWGYAADQRPSTHPVAPVVRDATEALLNFDGISYAKGASVLRQLVAWLGDEAFFAGLREHFAKNAYGNATLADLLAALSTASGRDLSEWSRVWLQTPQVSTLRPDVTLDAAGNYASVAVIQTSPVLADGQPPVLRPHRINVAAGVLTDGRMTPRAVVPVDVAGARTSVDALVGTPAGDLLLLNDGDLTYAKIRVDEASMSRLGPILAAVDDSLTRALLWSSAWDSTRDAELTAGAFIDICSVGLPAEDSVAIFPTIVQYALGVAIARFLPPDQRAARTATIAAACRTTIERSEPGSGLQLAAVRGLIRAGAEDDVAWMRAWLEDGSGAPAELAIDSELRWALMQHLAVLGAVDAADIEAEYDRDRTATAAIHAAKARASRPDPAAKATAWEHVISDDSMSNHLLFATAEGFWQPSQLGLTESYVDRYVTDVPAMADRRVPQVAEHLVALIHPSYSVDATALAKLTAMADAGLAPALARLVRDGNDDLARCLRAREVALG